MGKHTRIIHANGEEFILKDGKEYPYRFYHKFIDYLDDWWGSRDFRAKQSLFADSGTRYYGDGGTIHNTNHITIETHNGKVVAVWFRCQPLPFKQSIAGAERAYEMERMYKDFHTTLHGVEVSDNRISEKTK